MGSRDGKGQVRMLGANQRSLLSKGARDSGNRSPAAQREFMADPLARVQARLRGYAGLSQGPFVVAPEGPLDATD